MSAVLDIFAAPATPAWRTERPAQVRARMAWARQRLAAERAAPLLEVRGFAVGDRVSVEVRPGLTEIGILTAWERGANGALAHVDLPGLLGPRKIRVAFWRLAKP